MSTLALTRVITDIQVGVAAKKKKIFCRNTRISSKICSFLLNQGLIQQYTRSENNKYEIVLKSVRNISVIKKLHLLSKPSAKKFYSAYRIKTLLWKHKNYIYLISAPSVSNKQDIAGFINQHEAVTRRAGGEILLKIETI